MRRDPSTDKDAETSSTIQENKDDSDYEVSSNGSVDVEDLPKKVPPSSNRKSAAGRKIKAASPAVSNNSTLSRETSVDTTPANRLENDSILLLTHCIEATHEIVPVVEWTKAKALFVLATAQRLPLCHDADKAIS